MKADVVIDNITYVGAIGKTIEEIKEDVRNRWSLSEYAKSKMIVNIKKEKTMEQKFKIGEKVYFSDMQMGGTITEYKGDGVYNIEFETSGGGGNMDWHESDIVSANR